MIRIRRAAERGHFDHGWLDTRHTFSFAGYHDPEQMGFRVLRVINEDRVEPGAGFGTHPHRDMEIITYVIDGALEHRDSMGNGSVIRPGDAQRMSAGAGVTHSEFNHSGEEPVHFLQIWILPARRGVQPSYEQKTFTRHDKLNRACLIASPDGAEGSIRLHQDVRLYTAELETGQVIEQALSPGRHAWVQMVRGSALIDGGAPGAGGGAALTAGDGAALSDVARLRITAGSNGGAPATGDDGERGSAELLIFDLP